MGLIRHQSQLQSQVTTRATNKLQQANGDSGMSACTPQLLTKNQSVIHERSVSVSFGWKSNHLLIFNWILGSDISYHNFYLFCRKTKSKFLLFWRSILMTMIVQETKSIELQECWSAALPRRSVTICFVWARITLLFIKWQVKLARTWKTSPCKSMNS